MSDHSDTVIWVSGASRGIGAEVLAECPWSTARLIPIRRKTADQPDTVQADLSHPEDWGTVINSFRSHMAAPSVRFAIFVHCAATLDPLGYAVDVAEDDYQQQILLNAAAPLVLGQAFVSVAMRARVTGYGLLLSSGAAGKVDEGWSGYGPAKSAVNHWVNTVEAELVARALPCKVEIESPGPVATDMQRTIRETTIGNFPRAPEFVKLHSTGALREPKEAARLIWAKVAHGLDIAVDRGKNVS